MDKIRNIFFNRNIGIVILGSVILLFASMIYFKVLYPKISEKSFFIAETFSINGYHEKSLKELNKCLLLNIFDSKIYYKKADIYLEIGKNRAALTNYNMAIFLNKNNPQIYSKRSLLHTMNLDYARAELDVDKAIKLAPFSPFYYAQKATLYMEKNPSKAIGLLTDAIKLYKNFGYAYFLRGKLRIEKEDINGAIEDLSIAISIDPLIADNYAQRSSAYLYQYNPKAIIDAKKAVELAPKNRQILMTKAMVFYAFGYFAEAKKDIDLAKKISLEQSDYESYEKICKTSQKFGF